MTISKIACVLCVLLISHFSKRAEAAIFFDNFDGGASPLWLNESGDWTALGGVYFSTTAAGAPPSITRYSSLPFGLTDFTVSVDVNDLQDGGIALRSQDSGNGILLVNGGENGVGTGLYWHEVVGGNAGVVLNPSAPLFVSGVSDVNIRVDVIGDTYTAYVNGVFATSLTSTLYSSGRVGLYDASAQTFDNFSISVVPEPNALLMIGVPLFLCALRRSHRQTTR